MERRGNQREQDPSGAGDHRLGDRDHARRRRRNGFDHLEIQLCERCAVGVLAVDQQRRRLAPPLDAAFEDLAIVGQLAGIQKTDALAAAEDQDVAVWLFLDRRVT